MWTVSMLEITIEERAESERSGGYVPIPPLGTLQPGKGHRFSHFHSHPGCAGGGCFHQPQAGSLTQRQVNLPGFGGGFMAWVSGVWCWCVDGSSSPLSRWVGFCP